jgi:Lon protease-like protein
MALEPRQLALFPLNVVLFPGMTLPLRIFEPRYLQMVDDCMNSDQTFGVVCIKRGQETGGPAFPHAVGTTAHILNVEQESSDLLYIVTVGQERFRTNRLVHGKPYLVGEVEPYPLSNVDAPEIGLLIDGEMALLSAYVDLLSQVGHLELQLQRSPESPEDLAYAIATLLQVPLSVKQELLAIADLPTLLHDEAVLLRNDFAALTILMRGNELLESKESYRSQSEN